MSVFEKEVIQLLGPKAWNENFKEIFTHRQKAGDKPQDVVHSIQLSLEKLYTGTTIQIRAEKKIPCSSCAKNKTNCEICGGLGMLLRGQQPVVACLSCKGAGKVTVRCGNPKCSDGAIQEEKFFKVKVPAGARNGEEIRLAGQGDSLMDRPETVSDIVCTINEIPHKSFRRCGNDLYSIKNIGIKDALCGCKFVINHLDGRKLVVRSKPGAVIKPGDMRLVKNEGMPKSESKPVKKGDLIIIFNIVFPNKIDSANAEQIKLLLPPVKSSEKLQDDWEEVDLAPFDPKEQVYHVPFRQKDGYEDSPAKGGPKPPQAAQGEAPTCAQQ